MAIPSNYIGNINNQSDEQIYHSRFPKKYDFIQAPTLVGPYRALFYHKIRQLRYSMQNGQTMAEFFINQSKRKSRKEMFSEWLNRGNFGAMKLGINLPDQIPASGYGEIYGEMLYSVDGFIPDHSSTVVDVGAQYGDYSVMCSKVYGAKEVHAFEPLKSNVDAIRNLVSVNNVVNVAIHPIGLSDTAGSHYMRYDGEMLSTNDKGTKSQLFSFNTLDSFNLSCDLLKIDVEGFEMKVLKGGIGTIEENMPRIIMEVHSRKLNKGAMVVLKNLGYKLVKNDHFSFLNGFNQNLFLEPMR